MKILIFSNCPIVESQGSGYVIGNTAKSLESLGHEVEVISREEMIVLPKLQSTANLYRMALGMALWVMRNRKKIDQVDRVIYYGGESYLALFLIKSILKLSVPVILHSNGLEVHVDYKLKEFKQFLPVAPKKWYHFDTESLFRYCYKYVDTIITVSDYDRNFAISNLQVSPDKIFTLEPALPEIYFQQPENNNSKKPIIVFCGSWIVRKGIDSMKEAIPVILRANREYTFRMIGVGKAFNKAEHFPEDVLRQIEVFPFVDSKQTLIDLYSESEIFLFPSFCESYGLVVVEAMHCGCCVVTGPTGVAATLNNGVEALVLDIPESNNIIGAIDKLIISSELRRDMSNAGKKRVADLNWVNYRLKLKEILANDPYVKN